MKKSLVLSTLAALLSGLTAQAVTIQENTAFPTQDIIPGQSQQITDGGTQIMRNEDTLHVGAGQSFTLSSPETLAAITIQMGVGRNKSIAASGTHELELWIGSYDDTTASNHVVGATSLLTSIDVAGFTFSDGNYYTFNLDSALSLPAGDYAFQLYWTTPDQGDHRIWWADNAAGGYAGGELLVQDNLPATGGLPFEEASTNVLADLVFALHSAPITGVQTTLLTPEELTMSHVIGTGSTTGTVDAVVISDTTVDVTITISDESDVGAFSVVSATPQTLPDGTTELAFKFDNAVANLTAGEMATGLVAFAWTETGGGTSGTNFMPISASISFPAGEANAFRGYESTAWGTATNWNLGRVPGTLAADKALIQGASVVDVITNFTGEFSWGTIVRGDGSILNIGADFLNADYMTLGGASDNYGFVNQTLGSVDITALDIGHASGVSASNSVYTLSGGTLTTRENGTIHTNGQMVINGGTLIYNTTDDNDMFITGDGLLTLESGTWSSTGSAGGDVLTFTPDVEISGGTVALTGRNHFSGEFKVIGDAASISIQRLNIAPDFVFEFAPGGGSALSAVNCPTYVQLAAGTILVDGSNYNGGSAEIPLFTGSINSLPTNSTPYVITNFADGVTAEITVDMETDTAVLTITVDGFLGWAQEFGLTGDDALPETDVEPDGLNNLMEYALGGNPTIDDAAEVSPKTYTADDGGTDYFYIVSDQRAGDSSLSFSLGTKTSLPFDPIWDTGDVSFVGESAVVDNYKTVTNRTEATPNSKFIQLEVQQN
ncbi:hypothetical protein P4E94_11430 [Pontiellaceae bacterium B12219]|nr:hypothetical protein [Pontiellaceae bacterium B12219]